MEAPPDGKAPRALRVAAWSASGAWATGIFVLSSLNASSGLPFPSNGWDKLYHAAFFGVGGGLVALALRCEAWPWRRAVLGAALLVAGYGVLDEVHQLFTPGRSSGADDALADAVGATLGSLLAAGRLSDAIVAFAQRVA